MSGRGRPGRGTGNWDRSHAHTSNYQHNGRTTGSRPAGAGNWQNSRPGTSNVPAVDGGGDRAVQFCIRDEEDNWDNDCPLPHRSGAGSGAGDNSQAIRSQNSSQHETGNWDEDDALAATTNGLTDLAFVDRSKKTQHQKLQNGTPSLTDWMDQGRRNTHDPALFVDMSYSPQISLPGTSSKTQNGDRAPNYVEAGKEYVAEYQKQLDAVIEKVSKKPDKRLPLNPRAKPYYPNSDAGSSVSVDSSSCADSDMTSIVGSYNPSHMDENDHVFDNIDMNTYMSSTRKLAIYALKDQILATLNSHQVTIIEGYTGCGKTTQIPQYILDTYAASGKRCNIVVTQPRRIAAQSVADRVCEERKWKLGDLVGYQVGLSRRTSETTRLTYLTTGVLLQTLITRRSLQDYSHIIVDEVHERDLDTDLLLLVIKKLMVEKEDRHTKIVLMSATLNADKFADYFPKWRYQDHTVQTGIVKIPQKLLFKVQEYYLDTVYDLLGDEFSSPYYRSNTDSFEEPKLSQFSYETAIKIIECFDDLETSEDRPQLPQGERGGVLAFLPGLMEIDTMYKMCNEYSERKAIESGTGSDVLQWTIIPLHSTITSEEQQKVFCPTQRGHRKIILATNIAESSITVTDICYVIDFCLTKSIGCDPQTNYSCLRMEWASQDQCVQRKGRVGRVSDGYVFRMVPISFYNSLTKETVPDFEKACLENVVLCVKTLNLGSPKAILALAIDPPALPSIQNAIANLKEVGALTIESGGKYTAFDGDLTEMGRLMSKLPFDIRYSRLIALGHVFGVLEETIIIAAGLSVKSAFSYPFHRRLLAYMSKLSWSNETFSDCFSILTLFRTWHHKNTAQDFRGGVRSWARTYFVQVNVLREMNISIQDIQRRLANNHIHVDGSRIASMDMSAEQGLILKIVMAGAFYPNYFLRHRPDQKEYERNISRDLSGCNPLLTLVYNGFPQEQPGDLYAQHITAKYQWPNSIPYVKFAGSKALVEFDARGTKIGPLSLNLFRGIKMRHVRNQVSFKALRSDASYFVRDEELGRINNLVRYKAPPACQLPSVTKNDYMVWVTHVFSPTDFWVIYKTETTKFNDIQALLQQNRDVLSVLTNPIAGGFCITMKDGEPFRARIEYVADNFDMLVFLVDVGISMWKTPSVCFEFNQRLVRAGIHNYPGLAMKCRIVGIRPLAKYAGNWDQETARIIGTLLAENRNTMMMIVYSVVEGIIACDLYGKGVDNPQFPGRDVGIRHKLLTCGHAREIDEPKESQENNNIRYNHGFYASSEDQLQRYNDAQISKSSPPCPLRAPQMEDCIHDYLLRGPFSPLEMTFKALTASAHIKSVTVDGTSVNSVSLDQDPYSQTARLLIAAGVGISQRSGNVIARETTLMPPIPGLVGLLTMIFCPKMQLRAEKSPDAFSGCLSGLGIDPIHHQSVYPDHDMEVVFDTHFDKVDIERINHIRLTMNMVLNNADQYSTNPAFDIEHLRTNARREIRVLLERDRPTVEETFPHKEFAWAVTKNKEKPKEKEVVPSRSGGGRKDFGYRKTDVFPLHDTTAVDPDLRSSSPNTFSY